MGGGGSGGLSKRLRQRLVCWDNEVEEEGAGTERGGGEEEEWVRDGRGGVDGDGEGGGGLEEDGGDEGFFYRLYYRA